MDCERPEEFLFWYDLGVLIYFFKIVVDEGIQARSILAEKLELEQAKFKALLQTLGEKTSFVEVANDCTNPKAELQVVSTLGN